MRRSATLAAATVVLTTVAVLAGGGGGNSPAMAAELETFPGCPELLERLRTEALEHVGPYGLQGVPMVMPLIGRTAAADGAEAASDTVAGAGDAATAADPAGGADGYASDTGTNVQVAGVDEPDHVKLSGDLLAVIEQEAIRLLDVSATEPTQVGKVSTQEVLHPFTMLSTGRHLVVLGSPVGPASDPTMRGGDDVATDVIGPSHRPETVVAVYDVSAPTTPALVDRMTVDGRFASARLTGGRVLLVTVGSPTIPFVHPSGGPDSEARAEEANREAVREATIDQWIAGATDDDGTRRPVADCDRVGVPSEILSWQNVSIAAFDPARPLTEVEGAATFGAGETVYASRDRVYVAGHQWDPEGQHTSLALHAFATDGSPTYLASGQVDGNLLNQFAMDRYEGHLRVATTTSDPSKGTDSRITVLAERDGQLAEVGRVTGLGRPGETIRGIRYLGSVGYVVTFEQTDPLYTVDLSDPAAPQVRGELKIPGYSAYLHPTAEGQLIGVGSAADETGRITGLQVSLFDVTDLAAPTRTAVLEVPGASTPVEWDHHAFTWVGTSGLAVIPFEGHGTMAAADGPAATEPAPPDERARPDHTAGLLLVEVRDGQLVEVARVAAPPTSEGWTRWFQRSIVHDGTLLAVGPGMVWRVGFDGEVLAQGR